MPKYHFRDPRLWIQSCVTIAATVAVALSISGALSTPPTLGDPSTSPSTIQQTTQSGV
jgi:hypothetical protein